MKFIFFPLGYVLAHTSRCLEIAKVLRARGHQVIFAGDDPQHPRSKLGLVRKAGFRLERVREPFHPYGWDRFEKYGWTASALDLHTLHKWVPLQEIIEDQVELIRREEPDLVIGDASISASTSAYITATPAACIMNAYASHFLSPQSAFHPLARLYDRLILAPIRKRVYDRYSVEPVNALQLLRSIPLVSPDLPELYEAPSYFPHFQTVGPIRTEVPSPLPDWVDELDDGTPNVYITMGSTGFLDDFLQRVYAVLKDAPYRFVVTTGGQARDETIRKAPPNFRITDYAPGLEILKRSKALIFHGGNGTMYQALQAGVPMIALPSHLEQDVITKVGVRHGFCIKMRARRVSARKLLRNLERLMSDSSYVEAARGFSKAVKNADGAAAAAGVLERLAREGSPAGSRLANARS
ncbi:MAG: hypothetical protein KJ060_12365 [Candidatus Hydrogenedentes bacterium]|nr:hypothetical protein [Candidatus Hydrogenedentota bacterium]